MRRIKLANAAPNVPLAVLDALTRTILPLRSKGDLFWWQIDNNVEQLLHLTLTLTLSLTLTLTLSLTLTLTLNPTRHVDADPASFPPGPWRAAYGDYDNGAPGRPLFVSLLVYLDETWRREWDAETLFLEPASGARPPLTYS